MKRTLATLAILAGIATAQYALADADPSACCRPRGATVAAAPMADKWK